MNHPFSANHISVDFYNYRKPNRPRAYILAPNFELAKYYWKHQGSSQDLFQFVGSHAAYIGLPLSKPILVIVGDQFGSFFFPPKLQQIHWYLVEGCYNLVYKTMEMPIMASEYFA